MAAAASSPLNTHRFLIMTGALVDAHSLSPAQVAHARDAEASGEVTCPTCRGRLRVVISQTGPTVEHVGGGTAAEHEPEDQHVRAAKRLLADRLRELFPSGNVQLDVHLADDGPLADIALVNPMGGKMVVEYQTGELTADAVRERSQVYESRGIRCLWLLDARRLKLAKKGGLVKKATLNKLETALMACGEPVIYLQARERQIVWLRPHPDARELAALGEPRIGQVECLVRRYRFGALRIRDGQWWVDTSLDPRVAVPPGSLPDNLHKKLADRRGTAGA